MKIDRSTGEYILGNQKLGRDLNEPEFLRSALGFHDQWLREQLGDPPCQFAWGKALSTFEPHWYSANIVIDYTRPSQNLKTAEQ